MIRFLLNVILETGGNPYNPREWLAVYRCFGRIEDTEEGEE